MTDLVVLKALFNGPIQSSVWKARPASIESEWDALSPSNRFPSRVFHKKELVIRKTFYEEVPVSDDDCVVIQELRDSCCLKPIVELLVGIPLPRCDNAEL